MLERISLTFIIHSCHHTFIIYFSGLRHRSIHTPTHHSNTGTLTTDQTMIGTIVALQDTQTTQVISISSDTGATVTGVGFYSTVKADYGITFSCEDDDSNISSTIYNPSSVSAPNTLVVSGLSTSSCSNVSAGTGLTATLVYQDHASNSSNIVGAFMTIQVIDTETANVVRAHTSQLVSIEGKGFFSSSTSDYTIKITGDGCVTSTNPPTSVQASPSSGESGYVVLSSFNGFSSCTDTITATVTYGTYTSSATVASVVSVKETYAYQLVNNDTSYVTLVGSNFESQQLDTYSLTLSGGTGSAGCTDDIVITTAYTYVYCSSSNLKRVSHSSKT